MFRKPGLINSKAQDFPKGFIWLNTNRPLSLDDLKGQVIILDFWTYCCINCMHTLPDLDWIEKKYRGKPVIVIGVHSAKFYNEQEAENIQEAIGRYEINHPVIADKNMAIWQSYNVSGWPTLVVIDPKGNVVYQQSGEGQRENLDDVISVLLERHKEQGTLAEKPLEIHKPVAARSGILSYPSKMAFSPDGKMLAISDSNHNRILVVDADSGRIIHKIGGTKGFADGTFEEAKFFRPQGVLWVEGKVYVADTENHALREINLQSRAVVTLAGNGRQGHWIQSPQDAKSTQLSSAWDLAHDSGFIFIAMAGLHQIWAYHVQTGKIGPFAGSGHEDIVDGLLAEAQFAQPSGLAIFRNYLFVADSEISAIRRIDLDKKIVQTAVGEGLFVFGHKDGTLDEARLQHPLGVACEGNKVYVADTYNHAIRLIDLAEQKVSTMIGKPEMKAMCNINDPSCDTLGLFEPSDAKIRGNSLYIADTNNHLIRIFDLESKVLKTLPVKE